MAKSPSNYRSCTAYDPWQHIGGNKFHTKPVDKLTPVQRKAANAAWEHYMRVGRGTKRGMQEYCDKMAIVTGIKVRIEDLV